MTRMRARNPSRLAAQFAPGLGAFFGAGLVAISIAFSSACGGLVESSAALDASIATSDAGNASSADAGNPFAVICDGGPAADPARTCAVSFKSDILPLMLSTGEWGCASTGCHDSKSGVPPIIDA